MGCGCFLVVWRRAWYWRVRLSALHSSSEARRAAAGFQWFFARRCATTGVVEVQTEPGSLFMRQSTVAFGECPAFLARVVHTWKFGALFRSGLVPGSLVSGVWVLLVEYRYWIFREMLPFFGAQCLARQWLHVLHQYGTLLDELHTFSTLLWTRILRFGSLFLRRTEKCAQSMPQVLEFRISSQELHGAGRAHVLKGRGWGSVHRHRSS